MATAISDSTCKDDQSCPICLELFTTPRQLPCLHSFCEHCLHDYITKKASIAVGPFEEFICPVCRAITRPVSKDIHVGKWASLFAHSPISLVADSKAKVERACNTCPQTTNPATKFCIVCEEFMCDDCSTCHQKMKISRQHQMLAVEQMESDPKNRVKLAEGLRCPEHQDKEIEFYCGTHEAACCGKCSFLHHKTCNEVLELSENLANLLDEMNPSKIMEEMRKLQDHLNKFQNMNEANIGSLESQVNNISSEIGKVRNKINTMLDDIERMVQSEGNRIFKDEMIKTQERNHQCQSFINAVRNSHALLETVSRHGTDIQKFLVVSKSMKQIRSYKSQIQEKFVRVDSIKLMLEFDSQLKTLLSQDGKGLVKVIYKDESEILHSASTIRPLRERMVELSRVIKVNCPNEKNPYYSGVVQLYGGEMVLADSNNITCCLCDSSYNCIAMYTLPGSPYDMCLTDDNEVAVTMPFKKTVQFLSIKDCAIKDTGKVTTRYKCYGVAAVNKMEIVVSGHCGGRFGSAKCYWSLISKDGMEKFHREFDCHTTNQAYITLNTSKSRIYISVCGGHAVYCFGLTDGRQYFVYTANNLKEPLGVAVDMEDNVYVVGCSSHNIHKLSPDGAFLQAISSQIPNYPIRISFNPNRDQFILTIHSECKTLHYFIHK